MTDTKLITGDIVIINHTDAAIAKNVAMITQITEKKVFAAYLYADADQRICYANIDQVTNISEYGLKIIMDDDFQKYILLATEESKTAGCNDEEERKWQEFIPSQMLSVSKAARKILKRNRVFF
jgi:hypothetical protein